MLARLAPVLLRLALGTAFLSAVADRIGLWGPPGGRNVAWGSLDRFFVYTAKLNPFLPAAAIRPLGWSVTVAEIILGLSLIAGFRVRITASASAMLLLLFGLGMMIGDGVKAPFDSSVWSASAGAWLLAVYTAREAGSTKQNELMPVAVAHSAL